MAISGDSDDQLLDREYGPVQLPLYLEVLRGFLQGTGEYKAHDHDDDE
jgi:hypothetical protein